MAITPKMTARMENVTKALESTKSTAISPPSYCSTVQQASFTLNEFKALKRGLSPLIFLDFSAKCVLLINNLTFLIVYAGRET